MCADACRARDDCAFAHVFAETFTHHDLAHQRPPPPSPPSPPPPPPLPNPPLAPLPPATPPQSTLRSWGPELTATPEAGEDGRFAITCAIDGCGAALPVFKSSSQVAIVQKISQMASDGALARSVCPFECAREVFSHGLSFDAFSQLVTTSSLGSARLAYPRLSSLQDRVVTAESADAGIGATAGARNAFDTLEEIGRVEGATMRECGEYVEDRKSIAMHAVWLYDDAQPGLSPTGACALFLAARSQFQYTLWHSFFEHARRVTTIAHFETAVPREEHVAVARPPEGVDCAFDYVAPLVEIADERRRVDWRACVWWSEFQHDAQDELACSPDRDGANVLSPAEILAQLREAKIGYPPPSPPPPPPPPSDVSPPPPDADFRCASGLLPRASDKTVAERTDPATGEFTSSAKCFEWSDTERWPPFAVHADIYETDVGGCRHSPPPEPPSPPPPPPEPEPPRPAPPPSPEPSPPPPSPPAPGTYANSPVCTLGDSTPATRASDCPQYYVVNNENDVGDNGFNYMSAFQAWYQCTKPNQKTVDSVGRPVTMIRRGVPAIWWGSTAAHSLAKAAIVHAHDANIGTGGVWTSVNRICGGEDVNTNKKWDGAGFAQYYWDEFNGLLPNARYVIPNDYRGVHAGGNEGGTDECEEVNNGVPACGAKMGGATTGWIAKARTRFPWRSDEPNGNDCTWAQRSGQGFELVDTPCDASQFASSAVLCMQADIYASEVVNAGRELNGQAYTPEQAAGPNAVTFYPEMSLTHECTTLIGDADAINTKGDGCGGPVQAGTWEKVRLALLAQTATFSSYYVRMPADTLASEHTESSTRYNDMVYDIGGFSVRYRVGTGDNLGLHCRDVSGLPDMSNVFVDPSTSTATLAGASFGTRLAPTTTLVNLTLDVGSGDDGGSGDTGSGESASGDLVSGASASGYGRRLQQRRAVDDASRVVQWDAAFRQPGVGDQPDGGFTGPLFADCSDPNVPATHCCRVRITFWVSDDATDDAYYFENPTVTGCADVCGRQHLRTGEDTQCVPAQPECNDWDGKQSPQFQVSDLVLLEAYCLCGMRLSEVSAAQAGRRLDEPPPRGRRAAYVWDDARPGDVDVVSGGHFDASDQCYASSINYHGAVLEAMNSSRTCATASGERKLYTEMVASDIRFDLSDPDDGYASCATAEALDCCEVSRRDAMATQFYGLAGYDDLSQGSAWSTLGAGQPFGVGALSSQLAFAFDFNNDGYDDVVIGNRIFLSRAGHGVGERAQTWSAQRHVGRQFTSLTPAAMAAVHASQLTQDLTPDVLLNQRAGTLFTAIAYADNSVALYTTDAAYREGAEVVFKFNRTLDDGGRGAVSGLAVFLREVVAEVERVRVGVYVAYSDADDVVHYTDYPKRGADRATGYVATTSSVVPLRSGDGQRLVPSLSVAKGLWRTEYGYGLHGQPSPPPAPLSPGRVSGARPLTAVDLVFVGTAAGFPNLIATDVDGFVERPLGDTTSETSVDVATAAFDHDSAFYVIVCFANANERNACYRVQNDEQSRLNERLAEFKSVLVERKPFGNADEVTASVALADVNSDQFVDVITLEESGYVRLYRGDVNTQLTADFGHITPSTLDPSAARAYESTDAAAARRLQLSSLAGVTGAERFMPRSKLLIGACDHCTDAFHPARFGDYADPSATDTTNYTGYTCPPTHPVASPVSESLFGEGHVDVGQCVQVTPISLSQRTCLLSYDQRNFSDAVGVGDFACGQQRPFCVETETSSVADFTTTSDLNVIAQTAQLGFCSAARQRPGNVGEATRAGQTDRERRPLAFFLVHHFTDASDASPSCAMRCHGAGRMGRDEMMTYEHDVVTSVYAQDVPSYYAGGPPTACVCGPRFDALTAPHPPPLPPDSPPPPSQPPPEPPSASPSPPPPAPPFPSARTAIEPGRARTRTPTTPAHACRGAQRVFAQSSARWASARCTRRATSLRRHLRHHPTHPLRRRSRRRRRCRRCRRRRRRLRPCLRRRPRRRRSRRRRHSRRHERRRHSRRPHPRLHHHRQVNLPRFRMFPQSRYVPAQRTRALAAPTLTRAVLFSRQDDKFSRLIFKDLVPELHRLRAGGTAFIPHSVRIGLAYGGLFRDAPYIEQVIFSNKVGTAIEPTPLLLLLTPTFARLPQSCPVSYDQFADSFSGLNTSRSQVNFFVRAHRAPTAPPPRPPTSERLAARAQVDQEKPECALPTPGEALQFVNLNEQCSRSVVEGEIVTGLTFEPRCLVLVIEPESRRALFDELMQAGRPLEEPARVIVNYTVATEADPLVESASANCQSSMILADNYARDRVLQDELQELAAVRAARDTAVELKAFLEYALDNRTRSQYRTLKPAHTHAQSLSWSLGRSAAECLR
jgi:hypothetical protein